MKALEMTVEMEGFSMTSTLLVDVTVTAGGVTEMVLVTGIDIRTDFVDSFTVVIVTWGRVTCILRVLILY